MPNLPADITQTMLNKRSAEQRVRAKTDPAASVLTLAASVPPSRPHDRHNTPTLTPHSPGVTMDQAHLSSAATPASNLIRRGECEVAASPSTTYFIPIRPTFFGTPMTFILAASVVALLATIPAIETIASISALLGIELGTSFEDLALFKGFLKEVLSIFAA